jgi:hypothetical protein
MVTKSTGIVTTVTGNGFCGYSGDGGAATAATVCLPSSIAVDPSGNLVIADYYNARIRLISKGTGIITTIVGTGVAGSNGDGDGGLATTAQVSFVKGFAVAANGDLYIVDNNKVRMVSKSTGIITTVAGNNDECSRTYVTVIGDGVAATSGSVCASYIAVDAIGNLYIMDVSRSLRLVTKGTGIITTVAGTAKRSLIIRQAISGITIGTAQSAAFQTSFVNAVAAAAGVSVSAVSIAGVVSFYSTVYVGYSVVGVTQPPSAAALTTALVAAGYTGALVSPDAQYSDLFSNSLPTGDGGPAVSATFLETGDIAIDPSGNIYIIDNDRVRVVTKSTGVISTVAGGGAVAPVVVMQVKQYVTGATLATAQSAAFQSNFVGLVAVVYGLTVDAISVTGVACIDGTVIATCTGLYVSYTISAKNVNPVTLSNRLDGMNNNPLLSFTYKLSDGTSVAVSSDLRYSGGSFTFTTPTEAVVYGGGDGGLATSGWLELPTALAVDASGNVLISTTYKSVTGVVYKWSRFRQVSPAGIITTVAGYDYALSNRGDGGAATNAVVFAPRVCAVDLSNNLYMSSDTSASVRLVSKSTGTITTIVGTGVAAPAPPPTPAPSSAVVTVRATFTPAWSRRRRLVAVVTPVTVTALLGRPTDAARAATKEDWKAGAWAWARVKPATFTVSCSTVTADAALPLPLPLPVVEVAANVQDPDPAVLVPPEGHGRQVALAVDPRKGL